MFSRGFLGVVPTKLIETIARLCKPEEWLAVYVACSGTFRTERGLLSVFPGLELHSNDVSLFSTALGRAAIGDPLPFTFKGELGFIEELGLAEPADRIAAILVALDYSSYVKGKRNRFKQAHIDHMQAHFGEFVTATRPVVDKALKAMPIKSYFGGDFRDHTEAAIARGAGVISYPPTVRSGYERMFEILHENVDWTPPDYRLFDPADIDQVLQRLHDGGGPFFLYCDQEVEGFTPQVRLEQRGKRPIYGYARTPAASYRAPKSHGKPFAYRGVDLSTLNEQSIVTVTPAPESAISFLREAYLKKTIAFGQGDYGVLVHIDGMLAGAISYRKDQHGASGTIYVLTDLATTREGRIAKLVARIATCRETIKPFERRLIFRFKRVLTTAFSDHPEAMKYRGSWKVDKREEINNGVARYAINYVSEIRQETVQESYAWWWKRDGKREVAEARNRAEACRSADAEAA